MAEDDQAPAHTPLIPGLTPVLPDVHGVPRGSIGLEPPLAPLQTSCSSTA